MARIKQALRILRRKDGRKPKYLAVSRKSIGIIYINGRPYIYNADLVYHDQPVTIEQAVEDYEKKTHQNRRRVIVIRRK